MTIEKVNNGYVVKTLTETMIYSTLQEVFNFGLLHFEGKGEFFGGEKYGRVVIERELGL